MGLLDSLKANCTKMAKQAVKDAVAGGGGGSSDDRAPADAAAYAEKVADAISADVRCVRPSTVRMTPLLLLV